MNINIERNEEQVLDDCHMVFEDHIYLVDGVPRRSPITGTVKGLKRKLAASVIRRCDVLGRGLTNKAVPYTYLN